MHAILVLSAVSLALAAAPAAVAAPQQVMRYQPARSGYAYAPPPRAVCQRICPKDMAPCDPINFKIADGRCNPGMREGL
ncbi:hypothetical protein [Chelatococcus reniformis]|uniref:Kazal-like domain-containing protein n=1 Tax=Chelatococcus reniformis TaxID=1494448 RepID=A0A916TXE7_9HYPH|nr:hypothetical protein [Chelatococcus reniformis]GGC46946.1 hypothetical protein GCM10010994_02630 [Chelatococcus reniformis]